mgnify:CR=1 FL=1
MNRLAELSVRREKSRRTKGICGVLGLIGLVGGVYCYPHQNLVGSLMPLLAKRLGLAKKDDFKLLWVTEFPQFEYSEEEDRLVAMHHPFTAPMDEDIPLLDTDPAKFVPRRTTLSSTAVSWAAAPFVSTIPSCRPRCSRPSASPRRRPRSSSVT